jgi:hypothetical protein
MVTIENKKTEIIIGNNEKADYRWLVEYMIFSSNPIKPGQGYTSDELLDKYKIVSRIENTCKNGDGKEKFNLEDAEFKHVKECEKKMFWAFHSKQLIEFINYIRDLKPDQPKEKV